ncbi:MAG: endonuclease [Lacipirellulaceae bacterium]
MDLSCAPVLRTLALGVALLAAPLSVAGPHDPPANYYATATGTGATLKQQLNDIIDGHTVRSYDAARSLLQVTDRDPASPTRMLTVYDRVSINVAAINPGGSIPGWDLGVTWNREHTWPQSRNVDSTGPDSSDLHMLRPSDPGVNSARGNLNFGGAFGSRPGGNAFGSISDGGTFWYPGDADAGMIARQSFYMAVRYDGTDASTTNLELFAGNPADTTGMGNLNRLVEWHYAAPPLDFELRRNDLIHDSYQSNRNPFVDRPELAWSVFVDQANDSRLTLAGGNTSAAGASTLSVNLGRVYVGGSGPATAAVTLNKAGVDGAYYSVAAAGGATSTASGALNAFTVGATGSKGITIGLTANSATSGVTSGTVTIDNLDVTTGGGSGAGANDGDDIVTATYTVLDLPVASFSPTAALATLVYDFGTVPRGASPMQVPLSISNYAGAGGPSFASALELDAVAAAGDSAAFGLALAPFTGLAQGSGQSFFASINTSVSGAFSATYLLTLSGENLAGDTTQQLSLTLSGAVAAASLAGDYNADGRVDAADYSVWADTLGSTTQLDADGDASGVVDAADYDLWVVHYGEVAPASTTTVPEPSTLPTTLALLACGGVGRCRSAQIG